MAYDSNTSQVIPLPCSHIPAVLSYDTSEENTTPQNRQDRHQRIKQKKHLIGKRVRVCWMCLQLYTGSKDETVRLWDCKGRGECLSVVQVGGQVDSLLLEGGFLFVGLRVQGMQPVPGLIKVQL